ncbi:lasso peptide biosynthesis B2 protein [Peribacillus psychrosaccharolyticus]|uniref:lasso peptide biosynthesis B2 protein n=1 Tax=Peribacillus psychrosaccharolyticus TaxID=1407 RepID=UPI003D2D52F9
MTIFHKIKTFYKLDMHLKRLMVEAYLTLAWARYRKSKVFAKIAPSLGEQMAETTYLENAQNRVVLRNISNTIHMMSRYTFWESECLVKAMAGMKMLEKRGIESTLYLGTAKDQTGLVAHAWLRSGSFYISGSDGMERFTVVAKFAKRKNETIHEGENYGSYP